MRRIEATEFEAKCLAILDSLGPEGILVTKHDRPVAHVTPIAEDCSPLIGSMRDEIQIDGDLLSTGIGSDDNCGR